MSADTAQDVMQVCLNGHVITDRLRGAFNVSVAEVEAEDHRQLVVLGVAMVSNEVVRIRQAFRRECPEFNTPRNSSFSERKVSASSTRRVGLN